MKVFEEILALIHENVLFCVKYVLKKCLLANFNVIVHVIFVQKVCIYYSYNYKMVRSRKKWPKNAIKIIFRGVLKKSENLVVLHTISRFFGWRFAVLSLEEVKGGNTVQ